MSNKNQTAVEWLIEKLNQCEPMYSGVESGERKAHIDTLIEHALALERNQIVNAVEGFPIKNRGMEGNEYYNETYGKSE